MMAAHPKKNEINAFRSKNNIPTRITTQVSRRKITLAEVRQQVTLTTQKKTKRPDEGSGWLFEKLSVPTIMNDGTKANINPNRKDARPDLGGVSFCRGGSVFMI